MSKHTFPTGTQVTITTGTDIRGCDGVIVGKQGAVYLVQVKGKTVMLPASSLRKAVTA